MNWAAKIKVVVKLSDHGFKDPDFRDALLCYGCAEWVSPNMRIAASGERGSGGPLPPFPPTEGAEFPLKLWSSADPELEFARSA